VETYGSVLLYTWLDRDLSLAGRVSLLDGASHLVRLERSICRIPNLAIHLNPTLATTGLQLNPQQHATPVLALDESEDTEVRTIVTAALARSGVAGVGPASVAALDLCLYDVQPSSIGGAHDEFLYAPRLDNLASCHAALSALLAATRTSTATTRVVALLDHEEVGSQSASGAQSRFLVALLERLALVTGGAGPESVHRALARSLMISADMAHAVHPNFADRHDAMHGPRIGMGPVIKVNANQSYATDGPGAALFEQACRESGFSPQHFVSRNDMRCGTTIGPISAARTGIRTVDVGNPMLSMHSCREMAGAADVGKMIAALTYIFSHASVPPPQV
jgi:aspartyl aminopeptidase